jgi:hypothetical protein
MPPAMREKILHLTKELIWLAITAMVTYAVLYPVINKLYYLYTTINAAFIFIALTYFRWSVTFKSLAFLRPSWLRFLLFTANIVLFMYLLYNEQKLLGRLDDFYLEDFGFPKVIMYEDVKQSLFSYLFSEIVFFSTASLVMIVAFQLRLIISYWQYYKHEASRMLED